MVMVHKSVIFYSMSNCMDQPFCHKYLISIKSKAYPLCVHPFITPFYAVGWCNLGSFFAFENWFWRPIFVSWNTKCEECTMIQYLPSLICKFVDINRINWMKLYTFLRYNTDMWTLIWIYKLCFSYELALIYISWKSAQKEITIFE